MLFEQLKFTKNIRSGGSYQDLVLVLSTCSIPSILLWIMRFKLFEYGQVESKNVLRICYVTRCDCVTDDASLSKVDFVDVSFATVSVVSDAALKTSKMTTSLSTMSSTLPVLLSQSRTPVETISGSLKQANFEWKIHIEIVVEDRSFQTFYHSSIEQSPLKQIKYRGNTFSFVTDRFLSTFSWRRFDVVDVRVRRRFEIDDDDFILGQHLYL